MLTFATEFTVLIAGILVYKLAANIPEANGFSAYAIVRRTVSFIQPLLILGMGVGIPRYVAFAGTGTAYKDQGSYFVAGFSIVQVITVFFAGFFILFRDQFSFLIFGSTSYGYLVPYMSLMLFGMVTHSLAYGYLRGKMKMNAANILQLVNLGIVPLLVFLLTPVIENVLLFTGLSWAVISLLFSLGLFFSITWKKENLMPCAKELLRYGLQRVPGDVALAGFLALPAYFTAHLVADDLKTAGYVAFGMSLLNMVGAAFGPISLLMLPQASKAIAAKDFLLLRSFSDKIVRLTLLLTVLGLLMIEIFTEPIMKLYLGSSLAGMNACIRVILFASVGYSLYIALRSILDAYYVRAVNTKNIFIAFALFTLPAAVFVLQKCNYMYMLYSFITSMTLLGLLTYVETQKIFRKEL